MPTNQEVLNELDSVLLKDIEKRAAANMSPSEIAVRLGIDKAAFKRIWSDKDSLIRKAYEVGRLKIREKKFKALKKEVKSGNVTAIQILNKEEYEREFEAAKNDIFGFEQGNV